MSNPIIQLLLLATGDCGGPEMPEKEISCEKLEDSDTARCFEKVAECGKTDHSGFPTPAAPTGETYHECIERLDRAEEEGRDWNSTIGGDTEERMNRCLEYQTESLKNEQCDPISGSVGGNEDQVDDNEVDSGDGNSNVGGETNESHDTNSGFESSRSGDNGYGY